MWKYFFFPCSFTRSVKVSAFQVREEENAFSLEKEGRVEAWRHGGLV